MVQQKTMPINTVLDNLNNINNVFGFKQDIFYVAFLYNQ